MDTPNFHDERKAAKLSLNELATLTGFSKGHIANVEAGVANPSQRYIEAFNRATGNSDIPLTDQVPINKLVSDLAIKVAEADDLNGHIQLAAVSLKALAKLNTDMLRLISSIAKAQTWVRTRTTTNATYSTNADPNSPEVKILEVLLAHGIREHDELDGSRAKAFNKIIEKVWDMINDETTN